MDLFCSLTDCISVKGAGAKRWLLPVNQQFASRDAIEL